MWMCQFSCVRVCLHMHVKARVCMCGWQTRGAGRGRLWMVGGDVYLFMTQRPSVVSGGHGNTCPGPLSAALACGLRWPCQSLQLLQLLGSLPRLSLSFLCFFFCWVCTFPSWLFSLTFLWCSLEFFLKLFSPCLPLFWPFLGTVWDDWMCCRFNRTFFRQMSATFFFIFGGGSVSYHQRLCVSSPGKGQGDERGHISTLAISD